VAKVQRIANAEQAFVEFKQAIARVTPAGALIADVQLITKGVIQIVVGNGWPDQSKAIRLEAAEKLQLLWAAAYSPAEPRHARIRLITGNGTPLGGSRMWDGTLVYLAHDWVQGQANSSETISISSHV
jgi:hypothetical protein